MSSFSWRAGAAAQARAPVALARAQHLAITGPHRAAPAELGAEAARVEQRTPAAAVAVVSLAMARLVRVQAKAVLVPRPMPAAPARRQFWRLRRRRRGRVERRRRRRRLFGGGRGAGRGAGGGGGSYVSSLFTQDVTIEPGGQLGHNRTCRHSERCLQSRLLHCLHRRRSVFYSHEHRFHSTIHHHRSGRRARRRQCARLARRTGRHGGGRISDAGLSARRT